MAESPSSKLAAAAQELLKAAGAEVSSDAQKKISTDLVSFKESFDARLNTVNQSITTLRSHADDKANTADQRLASIDQRLASLEQKVLLQTQKISKQTKLQTLSFAMQNAVLVSFTYFDTYSKESSTLVSNIMISFRRGFGYHLPDGTLQNIDKHYYKEKWEKSNKDFRDKLVEQIHGLTGTKPRVVREGDGPFAIYYS